MQPGIIISNILLIYFDFSRAAIMAGIWAAVASALLRPKDEAETLKKENARIDKEIENKKLEIKKIKMTIKNRRKEKFHKKLTRMPAEVKMVNIDGLSRTSDE